MSKSAWLVVVVVAVVFGLGGFAVGKVASDPGNGAEGQQASNWLFSQTADRGTISPNGDGTWTLTLTGVDPAVLGFTDRPLREAQIGRVERLVEAWPVMFADADPNGVVVAHNDAGETNSAVVQLMDPILDGSTMTYTVKVLTNEGGPAEPGVTYDFGQVSVFIDDLAVVAWVCIGAGGQLINPPGRVDAPVVTESWRTKCELSGGQAVPQPRPTAE